MLIGSGSNGVFLFISELHKKAPQPGETFGRSDGTISQNCNQAGKPHQGRENDERSPLGFVFNIRSELHSP